MSYVRSSSLTGVVTRFSNFSVVSLNYGKLSMHELIHMYVSSVHQFCCRQRSFDNVWIPLEAQDRLSRCIVHAMQI